MILAEVSFSPDISWLGIINSIILFAILFAAISRWRSFVLAEEQNKKNKIEEEKNFIMDVCKAFTNTEDYKNSKEKRVLELADIRINDAFTQRGPSFLDVVVFNDFKDVYTRDQARLEKTISENTKVVSELVGKVGALIELTDGPSKRK